MSQSEPPATTSGTSINVIDREETKDAVPTEPDSINPTISQPPPHRDMPQLSSTPQLCNKIDQLCATQLQTNRLLGESEDVLKVIRRTLISTHFADRRRKGWSRYCAYAMMNGNGELPWMYHLEDVYSGNGTSLSRSISVQELVGYLKFYCIGAELIEDQSGNIKPGREADAQRLLASHLCYANPPAF
ncbi:unnamed protein product [Rhizoctonia solani]|uniref:Uncharacterized protein n=1 Tax=Rhizoctonia solani TaxID=456999 RepID=A0A8H2XWC9_9AGAM|nr:unnamed protein product [Rhizoctonia solani]